MVGQASEGVVEDDVSFVRHLRQRGQVDDLHFVSVAREHLRESEEGELVVVRQCYADRAAHFLVFVRHNSSSRGGHGCCGSGVWQPRRCSDAYVVPVERAGAAGPSEGVGWLAWHGPVTDGEASFRTLTVRKAGYGAVCGHADGLADHRSQPDRLAQAGAGAPCPLRGRRLRRRRAVRRRGGPRPATRSATTPA